MSEVFESRCTVCRNAAPCRHYNFYVIGSEGTKLCQPCQIKVNEFIRGMMSEHMDSKVAAHKAKRAKIKSGESQ